MLKPLSDNIVLEPQKESKKKSAILLPESVEKEKSETGKVVAVGPDVKNIKKGMVVAYKKYAEHKLKVKDTEYMIVKLEDVLAIID